MATEHSPQIRFNAIAPGFFLGEQNRFLLLNNDDSPTPRGQQIIDHKPMRRFGEPDDLSGSLLWLVSDASRFVTGIVVPVDGGVVWCHLREQISEAIGCACRAPQFAFCLFQQGRRRQHMQVLVPVRIDDDIGKRRVSPLRPTHYRFCLELRRKVPCSKIKHLPGLFRR